MVVMATAYFAIFQYGGLFVKFIGFYDYTVILTYISLISGMIGIRFAHAGHLIWAVGCLMLSGLCDMFDGVVARSKKNRTADEKNFGIQLDSLCDAVCFGVLPAILLYFCGVTTVWGVAALIFYTLCAVIRLAFFNVLEIRRQATEDGCAKYYRGLPVTSVAILLPLVFALGWHASETVQTILYHALPLVMGILFITDVRIPKINIAKFLPKRHAASEQDAAEEPCCHDAT